MENSNITLAYVCINERPGQLFSDDALLITD